MLAVELLLLMVGEDLTPTKFFGKVSVDFPEMEVAHAEELVLLFLFLRGKSARSTSSEKDDQRDEAYVKKADSAPTSRQAGIQLKAKVGSLEDFVEWLGGEKSARKNLPIRIREAESIVNLALKLGVGTKKITHWIRKVRSGVFARPSRKNGGRSDSGRKLKDDNDARKTDSAPVSGQTRILPKAKIESFDDFVKWLGGEEEALDTLSARIKKVGSAANLSRQIKVNENTFYGWAGKLKSRKTNPNLKSKTEQKPISQPEPLKKNMGSRGDSESANSATERILLILKDKEVARSLILEYKTPKNLAAFLNTPQKPGEMLKNPVTNHNLAWIIKTKFGLVFRDVLKESGRSGSGSRKPSAIALEVEQLSGIDQDTKDALIALAGEREVNSLRNLFDSIDDGGNNLSRAARVFSERGIIKRGLPPDYVQFKRSLIKS
jgi:hypothetical protein